MSAVRLKTTSKLALTALAALVLGLSASCSSDGAVDAPLTVEDDASASPDTADAAAPGKDAAAEDSGGPPDTAPLPPPPADVAERLEPGQVRAGIIQDNAARIGGIKSDGGIGDLKIYNAYVAFVVEGPGRAKAGYRYWGGNVVDADIVRPEGELGRDVFSEVWHTWNLHIFRPDEVEIVDDGSDGQEAHVRLTGGATVFDWAWSFLGGLLGGQLEDLHVVYDYRLGPEDHHLRQTVTLTNLKDQPMDAPIPLTFSNQGDGLSTWSQPTGFDFEGGPIEALNLVGWDVSHSIIPQGAMTFDVLLDYSNVVAIMEPAIDLAPGESLTHEYLHLVAEGGSAAIDAGTARLLGKDEQVVGTLAGTVAIPDGASAMRTWVAVRADGAPVATVPLDPATGGFEIEVAAGSYSVVAYAPGHAPSEGGVAEVVADATAEVSLQLPAAARVKVTVQTSDGVPVDGRVRLVAQGATPSPFPQDDVWIRRKGEWRWGGSYGKTSAIGYAMGGEIELWVPAGEYEAVATRGFSYEVDEQPVTATAETPSEVALVLDRVVDTTGWVSADFHIHALRSPDSDTPYDIRARQAASEDLDLPILTEHVQIGGLQEVIEELDLTDLVIGIHGQEVTTFEYGHFNAFPLAEDPDGTNYGAVFPYDKRPAELFEAIRNQSEGDEIIQVNHPRGSDLGSYFSWAGLSVADLSTDKPDEWDTNWDAIEVFNGSCGGNEVLADWIAMTNAGWRKTLAGGSDSHREDDPIGLPRVWIQVDRAEVAADHHAVVAPVRERRAFVSCGPFVRFETADGAAGLGDLADVAGDGTITFHVQVQAPSWITLDDVMLYRNGVVIAVVPIEVHEGGVRLDTELTDQPAADAWYAVEVKGHGSLLPVHKNGPPRAFTNAIEVDADGDGEWTPPGLTP